jgi:hypothetical protein
MSGLEVEVSPNFFAAREAGSVQIRTPAPKVATTRSDGRRPKSVRENAERGSIGYQFAEQLQLLRRKLALQIDDAGEVRAGSVEAGDKTQCDRVSAGGKDGWNRRGRRLHRKRCRGAGGYDHRDAAADEFGCKRAAGQPLL